MLNRSDYSAIANFNLANFAGDERQSPFNKFYSFIATLDSDLTRNTVFLTADDAHSLCSLNTEWVDSKEAMTEYQKKALTAWSLVVGPQFLFPQPEWGCNGTVYREVLR